MSTLMIVGGSGFFGKSIIDCFIRGQLNRFGIKRVVALARNASRLALETSELITPYVDLINADITSIQKLPEADLIIHAASSSNAQRYAEGPEQEVANIIKGADHFCDLVLQTQSKPKVLYCSSGAVYGRQPPELIHIREDYSGTDDVYLNPDKSAYAFAKRKAEIIFRKAAAEHDLKVCIARCFAFVGKWLPRDSHFAIGNFIRDAMTGNAITVKAAYPVYRSYMYVDDLVQWLIQMTISASPSCPIYNVGSDESIEIGDLALLIGKMCGVAVATPNRQYLGAKNFPEAMVDRYVPSIDKVKQEIGLQVSYNLRDAIISTINLLSQTNIK